jgi:hypothetical protein
MLWPLAVKLFPAVKISGLFGERKIQGWRTEAVILAASEHLHNAV